MLYPAIVSPPEDAQHLSGDVGRVVACEEQYRAGQILRLADAAERHRAAECLFKLLGIGGALLVAGEQVGVGRPGTDHVDRDVVARMLARECLGEADEAGLAGRIDGLARRSDARRIG